MKAKAVKATDTIVGMLQQIAVEQERLGEQLDAQGETLTALLALLERGRGARDAADEALFVTVANTIGDRRWTGGQLFAHSQASEELRDALTACDITNARELGQLCRRMEGEVRPGLWLERVGESRDGIVWQMRVRESQTREP